jgi:hypothetical protein
MRKTAVVMISMLLALLVAGPALSSQGGYDIPTWTVDGGGHTFSQGGTYALGGTVGQPDAGLLTGGDYTLGGGFWGGGVLPGLKYRVYLPLLMRQHQ